MRVSRILQLKLIVVVSALFMVGLAERVTAVTVTIHHAGGTLSGTLSGQGLQIDPNGNITLTVNEDLTGGCTNNAPTITVPNPPSSATVGSPISATFTTSDQDNDTVTVTANRGQVVGNTWTWTPTTAGTYTVTLTAYDGKDCNNTSTYTFNITVSSSSPPPPSNRNYTDITTSGRLPNYLRNQSVAPYSTATGPGAAYYKFTTDTDSFKSIIVNLEAEINSTGNYTDGIDLIVGAGVEPSCSQIVRGEISSGKDGIWYSSNLGRGNEAVNIVDVTAIPSGSFNFYLIPRITFIYNPLPRNTYYIAVCNFSDVTGKFRISWQPSTTEP